jgi:DNA polymerase-3 subunit epsilon
MLALESLPHEVPNELRAVIARALESDPKSRFSSMEAFSVALADAVTSVGPVRRVARSPLPAGIAIDTLELARRKFPGAQASLDALCRRFAIDNSARTKHGALLDAELLAEVYLELIGGRQPGLELVARATAENGFAIRIHRDPRPARPHLPTEAELAAHQALVARLRSPIWLS